jgi:hypothetical protein
VSLPITLWPVLGAGLLAAPAAAPVELASFASNVTLEELGLPPPREREASGSAVLLTFASRKDAVLLDAHLVLALAPIPPDAVFAGLDVFVNQERVGGVTPAELAAGAREKTIVIPAALMGEQNTLTLRLTSPDPGDCAPARRRAWHALAGGALHLRGSLLPLPNRLALLPLPFVDQAFDRSPRVAIAFLAPPNPAEVRAAALVASWFGRASVRPMTFAVSFGLPADNAIVLATGAEAARALGLAAVHAPTLRLLDDARPRGQRKLLVLAAPDAEGLAAAALALDGVGTHEGDQVVVEKAPAPMPSARYEAPRWVPAAARIPFGRIPGGDRLLLQGQHNGTLALRFRLAPDVFFWATEHPALELVYDQAVAAGANPPRVDVVLNGHFLATLPPSRGARAGVRLPIYRDHLAGYNELLIHVDHGHADCNAAAAEPDLTRFSIDPQSSFALDGYTHFAQMPDVASFVHDGFPFTRRADLSETLAVLPDRPQPAEIATLLSLVAHFASISGALGAGLTVDSASHVEAAGGALSPKDLLVVGTPQGHALLRRWQRLLPLSFATGRPRPQRPELGWVDTALALFAGQVGDGELGRATEVLRYQPRLAAAMGLASPLHAGRAALIVTATQADDMPAVSTLQGDAQSRGRANDLLVAIGGGRWMFRLGPSYGDGELAPRRRFLWTLAQHWVLLFPLTLLGIVALGLCLARVLRARAQARLAAAGGSPRP